MHQPQHFVGARLQGDMEMRHEGSALRAELQDLIGEQVGFDAGDTVALDSLDVVQSAQQIKETLARRASEVADIYARDDDLLATLGSCLLRLSHQRRYRAVATAPAGKRYRAIGAEIVAAVLHFEEVARTVAAGTGGDKGE